MDWRKRLSDNSNLYLILDAEVNDYEKLLDIALKSVNNGVDIIQLRDKSGSPKAMTSFYNDFIRSSKRQVPFIINDRVDVCDLIGASGVHLGQADLPLRYARRVLGQERLIGKSCQTITQAREAQDEGADYIGFGSVFKTLTKPDRMPMELNLIEELFKWIDIPVFAIGGIMEKNLTTLKKYGLRNFAVCRAICLADDVGEASKSLKSLINS